MDYEKLSGNKVSKSSESIRKRVEVERDIQNKRFTNGKATDIVFNADMRIGRSGNFTDYRLRSEFDAGTEEIQSAHLVEALQYRPKIMMG